MAWYRVFFREGGSVIEKIGCVDIWADDEVEAIKIFRKTRFGRKSIISVEEVDKDGC